MYFISKRPLVISYAIFLERNKLCKLQMTRYHILHGVWPVRFAHLSPQATTCTSSWIYYLRIINEISNTFLNLSYHFEDIISTFYIIVTIRRFYIKDLSEWNYNLVSILANMKQVSCLQLCLMVVQRWREICPCNTSVSILYTSTNIYYLQWRPAVFVCAFLPLDLLWGTA